MGRRHYLRPVEVGTSCSDPCLIRVQSVAKKFVAVNRNWNHLVTIATKEVDATLAALPEPLREKARKLPVTFEPVPNAGLQADGIAVDTLGLFVGPDYADEEAVPMPAQIILFLENIREFAEDDEEIFCEEIATTLLHELGHYLGLDEEDLTDRGLE